MKKLLYVFAIISFASFTSCSNNSDDDPINGFYFRYTINQVPTEFSESEITVEPGVLNRTEIDATKREVGTGNIIERLTISVPQNYAVGTYPISGAGSSDSFAIWYASEITTGANNSTSTGGTVVITSVDNGFIEGTFSTEGGHGMTNVILTNGSFRVPFD